MNRYWLGHRDRLRQRAQAMGPESLRPHEVVELVLFYAVPRADVSGAARALVEAMGSPHAVFHATPEELMAVSGVTRGMAEWCALTGELMDAYADVRRSDLMQLWRYRDVAAYLAERWRDVPAPRCRMLYTDYDDRLMLSADVCDSLQWWESGTTRGILQQALLLQARHAFLVLFVGPEPVEPDPEERERVVAFARTLRAVEVELMDCVRVGEQGLYSMSVDGGMERARMESDAPALHERYRAGTGSDDDEGGIWPDE